MMSRRNGRRHINLLVRSQRAEVDLAFQVEERFKTVCELYWRTHQTDLIPTKDLDGDMLRWRTMVVRHKAGDFRHTEAELKSVKVIAQWTLDINCDLRGQPRQNIKWAG